MNYDISKTALDRIAIHIPEDSPVHMLNLLRFRPDGGREAYFNDYIAAFRAIVAARGTEGIAPIWTGDVTGFVAGPEAEAWDAIIIVRYPSLSIFREIVDSESYRKDALPHRLAAVSDWRLIAHTEMKRPV